MKCPVIFCLAYFVSVEGQNRIAGGEVVQINQYPFAAALLTNRGVGTAYLQACGGTILTTDAILSAASCFYTNDVIDAVIWWRVRVGTPFANRQGTVYLIRSIEAHPDFSPATLANDIAVLRTSLSMRLQWGAVQPARLAGGSYQLHSNQEITAIGWGAATNRIAGGEVVQINQYPFAAALLTNRGVGTAYLQACGGTILTTDAILSAASCFYTNDVIDAVIWWRVRVGTPFANRQGTVYLIRSIEAHPDFSPATLANDIAVLRTSLSMRLQWGAVQPARLAGGSYQLHSNQEITAIGWGAATSSGESSEQLRHVRFWVIDHAACAERYSSEGFTVSENMVCAGWLDVGVRAQCQGDNGSPLVVDGVVVGVHSWTKECTDGMFPAINSRVAPYARWIEDVATL